MTFACLQCEYSSISMFTSMNCSHFSEHNNTVMQIFSPQTLVKLNPKLQPMVDMIKANRVKWEELDKKRHDHSASAPVSPCSAADGSETGSALLCCSSSSSSSTTTYTR